MKVKPREELEQAAGTIWQCLDDGYQPCETIYIISELTKRASLAMLQREQGAAQDAL